MSYWSLHTHTGFSRTDGMGTVAEVVAAAKQAGHEALAVTDHGVMAGAAQLYREARKSGLLPFPGEEFYVSPTDGKDEPRYHLGLLALDYEGYRGLARLSSLSHTRPRFHRFPRVTMADLDRFGAEYGDHVVVTTGCFFGLIPQALMVQGQRGAVRLLKWLAERFKHVFVEAQHHGITRQPWSDTELCLALYDLAAEVGLPMVVTQDSHYCVPGQQVDHDTMKRLVYATGGDEAGYPGESYHVATGRYLRRLFHGELGHKEPRGLARVWDVAQGSYGLLIDSHRLTIPALDEYRFHVPGAAITEATPQDELVARCREAMASAVEQAEHGGRAAYEARLDYELDVIGSAGFADYLIMVANLLTWCRKSGVMTNVRGSANGSLVCHLLGITAVDPMAWGTDFDRFLTTDRSKPPDIDVDIESARRDEVVDHLAEGRRVVQIGTWSTYGLDDEGKGSLFRLWESAQVKAVGRDEFVRRFGNPSGVDDIPAEEAMELRRLAGTWVTKSCGAHAGGFIIEAESQPIDGLLPIGLVASADREITQFPMADVEAMGYVKLDLLGLKTLTAVRLCLEALGRDPVDGLEWVPMDDRKTMKWLRRGKPDTGVFQFDGWTAAHGLKELKPRTVEDLVLANALYRPATINAGHKDELLARRNGEKPVVYRHPIWEAALASTWGVPVYQEQVMAILRGLGVPAGDLNRWLKALKSSNSLVASATATINSLKDQFMGLCQDHGVPDPAGAFDELVTFSEYSFNRAHAVAYGLLGYRTAYLATHHPLEWYGGLLASDTGKEREYVRSARDHGLRILGPHVNLSGPRWTIDRGANALRRGLVSVKGVGLSAAQEISEHAPYESVCDLIERTDSRRVTGGKSWSKDKTLNGVLAKLAEARALKGLE